MSDERTAMRVIDLLKALVDLPIEVLRESSRFNPEAELATEGCDCWGEIAWVGHHTDGVVGLYREPPAPHMPESPKTWFTRNDHRVRESHPDAFVEINEDWIQYFAEHERI